MKFAQVIVDIAHSEVDHVFDYIIPDGMELWLGQRVRAPFSRRSVDGFVVGLTDTTNVPLARLKHVERVLEDTPSIPPELVRLAHHMHDNQRCLLVEALRLMIPAQLRTHSVSVKTRTVAHSLLSAAGINKQIEGGLKRSKKQAQVLAMFSQHEIWDVKELCVLIPNARAALNQLAAKGFVELREEEELRTPYRNAGVASIPAPELLEAQREVIAPILEALDGSGGSFLLHGVTGSGKTEVYFNIVERALARNQGAIILVPEISLTPQMVERFRQRFGSLAALMHSRLSAGERYDEWRRIRRGEARVAIGARSCVFAPVDKLKLIVVDEEHESAYRSDNSPRYDAIEIAAYRMMEADGVLLMGSATPSLERYRMAREGKLTLLKMDSRIAGRPMPEVKIVDMREELAKGNRSIFSGALLDGMSARIKAGEQVMLFVNRRGYFPHVSCRECGEVLKCGDCDVALTLHLYGRAVMRCHYCGGESEPPPVCPRCGSPKIKQFGLGTQRIEDEVKKLFPSAPVARMDVDTTGTKDAHLKILGDFRRLKTQVLVGTQMITKGLDFPEVTLVGMVAADISLYLPDFRSQEKTFQLIAQMAGRAGRADKPGLVVVQTYSPHHYAIVHASKHDYDGFYQKEIVRREREEFPPFTKYARVLFSGDDDAQVAGLCERFHDELRRELARENYLESVHTLVWGEAPAKRLRAQFRYQTLVKLYENGQADDIVEIIYRCAQGLATRRAAVYIEVNPQSLM